VFIVSAPGFVAATVDDVVSGVGGCLPLVAPSEIAVMLTPDR
jgi:hypothetical protein